MSLPQPAAESRFPLASSQLSPSRSRFVGPLFTAAIFLNAALLFAIQPMFSKMVLPLLGGTPAVWNTCMVFFQTALLGGYLYAHVGSTRLSLRTHTIVHVALLALSALALPIGVARGFETPSGTAPVWWLVGLLTVSLGAPFFMLSAGAPLLQRWFSRTGHPDAANPYFLYAASNLGSMIALLAYPGLIGLPGEGCRRLSLGDHDGLAAGGRFHLQDHIAGRGHRLIGRVLQSNCVVERGPRLRL